ncbi:MAG: hypothetical protein Ct9H300mP32_3880 [Verrucomicrobiota bacterium]|nr:MAG: hypothetical protein Ct9H300mP32_3880 [Verrucomicrobiota bacterium]
MKATGSGAKPMFQATREIACSVCRLMPNNPVSFPGNRATYFSPLSGLDEEVLIRKTTWNGAKCERAPVGKFSAQQLLGLLR